MKLGGRFRETCTVQNGQCRVLNEVGGTIRAVQSGPVLQMMQQIAPARSAPYAFWMILDLYLWS
jgi:hypothetical protein